MLIPQEVSTEQAQSRFHRKEEGLGRSQGKGHIMVMHNPGGQWVTEATPNFSGRPFHEHGRSACSYGKHISSARRLQVGKTSPGYRGKELLVKFSCPLHRLITLRMIIFSEEGGSHSDISLDGAVVEGSYKCIF